MATKLYKATEAPGTEYTRCRQINIDNPANAAPVITMHEERVIEFADGRVIAAPPAPGNPGAPFIPPLAHRYKPDEVIEIVDPATFEPTGVTVPAATVYAAIFSLYIKLAQERDAAQP